MLLMKKKSISSSRFHSNRCIFARNRVVYWIWKSRGVYKRTALAGTDILIENEEHVFHQQSRTCRILDNPGTRHVTIYLFIPEGFRPKSIVYLLHTVMSSNDYVIFFMSAAERIVGAYSLSLLLSFPNREKCAQTKVMDISTWSSLASNVT